MIGLPVDLSQPARFASCSGKEARLKNEVISASGVASACLPPSRFYSESAPATRAASRPGGPARPCCRRCRSFGGRCADSVDAIVLRPSLPSRVLLRQSQ